MNDIHNYVIHNFIRTKCHTDQSEVLETLIRNTLLSLYDQKAHALLLLRRVTLPAYEKRENLGAVQVKGIRFVIFWFRRYEKIVLERRLSADHDISEKKW